MANGSSPSLVAVGVAGGDGPGEALVVAGRGDGDDRGAVGGDSARLAAVSVTVGATSVIVMVMTSVSVWVAPSETCTVRS